MTFDFTVSELELLIEALAARASRLESYGRAKPRSAASNDRKAEAMRKLRERILAHRSVPGIRTYFRGQS